MDKVLQKIFDDSEKAEFLEAIQQELPKARRAIILFESPADQDKKLTNFQYYQMGFKQLYEVLGFLSWLDELIRESESHSE